jgi:hypothetical protein
VRGAVERIRSLVHIQLSTIYRFPVLELLIAFFFAISLNGVSAGLHPDTLIPQEDPLVWGVSNSVGILSVTVNQFTVILTFLTPMLVAFTIAKPFEDGSFRTLLSYPLTRFSLFSVNTILPIVLLGCLVNISVVVAILLFSYSFIEVSAILLSIASVFLYSFILGTFSTAIAVISRSTAVTSIGSIGVWFTLYSIAPILKNVTLAYVFVQPISSLGDYFNDLIVLSDIASGFLLIIVASILLFFISYLVLNRAEV